MDLATSETLSSFNQLYAMRLNKLILQAISNGQTVEMADLLRSNGKLYVVVAILLVILLGMFLYLINLDRKISALEKQQFTSTDSKDL